MPDKSAWGVVHKMSPDASSVHVMSNLQVPRKPKRKGRLRRKK
jgi:hypothetical protein